MLNLVYELALYICAIIMFIIAILTISIEVMLFLT